MKPECHLYTNVYWSFRKLEPRTLSTVGEPFLFVNHMLMAAVISRCSYTNRNSELIKFAESHFEVDLVDRAGKKASGEMI